MEIINPKDASSFLQICQKALEENEVNSNLILGISNTLTKNNYAYGTNEPFFSIAMNNDEISLIGLMTPPKNLLIYEHKNLNIVSMAKKLRPTKHGMAIGYVYTPIEYRGKGYATALVTELSQYILDSGKLFCTLYTDLSNPTSNSIYQKIGYNPICDNVSYIFEYE